MCEPSARSGNVTVPVPSAPLIAQALMKRPSRPQSNDVPSTLETVNVAVLAFDVVGGAETSSVSRIRNRLVSTAPRLSEKSRPCAVKVYEPSGSVTHCDSGHVGSGAPCSAHVAEAVSLAVHQRDAPVAHGGVGHDRRERRWHRVLEDRDRGEVAVGGDRAGRRRPAAEPVPANEAPVTGRVLLRDGGHRHAARAGDVLADPEHSWPEVREWAQVRAGGHDGAGPCRHRADG